MAFLDSAGLAYVWSKISSKLNAKAERITYTATLSTSWSGSSAPFTQAVTVNGILASDTPHITPIFSTANATAKSQKEAWAMISKAQTAANKITFTCFEEKPSVALTLQIEVVR